MASENPAGVAVVGPGAPYITPATLTNASTGIAWSLIPDRGATAAQQLAEQLNICARATAQIDAYCNQPLRATVDVEELTGPGDFRVQNQPTGVTRLLLSRGPVLTVVSGQVSASTAFPRSWQSIPANQFEVEKALIGLYGSSAPGASAGGGQSVLLAPGWVTWLFGRQSSRIQVTYINGWPHAALTGSAAAGATSISVDDITGWLGAAGNVYDTGGFQEFISVTGVTPATTGAISGPGTLTLSAGLAYPHAKGVNVTTLPQNVMQAAIYLSLAQALTRGSTATTVQTISGSSAGGGAKSSQDYEDLAYRAIHPYKRVI